jgi:hypothetical protein
MIYRRRRRSTPKRIETREEYMRKMRTWVIRMIQQVAQGREI